MKYHKLRKIFTLLITTCLIWGCGYEPILNKDNQKFSISEFNFEGNKRLGGLLKNNLIVSKGNENSLLLNVESDKKTTVNNKSQTGKVLTYALTLNFKIIAKKNDKTVFSRIYTKTQNYAAADVHSDTLKNEKKLVEILIESIANELLIELNSIDIK
tara:strand:+ start:3246 stop:3716 length:471 start_codon:yes stop_codon:yes gene_type:complete